MGHGDHWGCVEPNFELAASDLLALAISDGQAISGSRTSLPYNYDDKGEIVKGPFENLPMGLQHDVGPFSVLAVVVPVISNKSAALWTGYPYLSTGKRVELEITRITPWENGIEAEISGETTDGLPITYFDLYYFKNANRYQVGAKVEVELGAIAFSMAHPEDQTILIEDVDTIRTLREDHEDPDNLEPIEVHTKGMAGMLPIENWDDYEYHFQGPVKAVENVIGNGQAFYRVTASVMRAEEDFDLPILVAKHVIEDRPPQVGDDIAGQLWVHGHLKVQQSGAE